MPPAAPVESIPGDYQYRALHHGPRVQQFWHRNKMRVLHEAVAGLPIDVMVDLGCGSGNLFFNSGLTKSPSWPAAASPTGIRANAFARVAARGETAPVELSRRMRDA